ncbi:CopD family protein [Prochlorococcus sp. AH-716-P05]|nr:CopD family protein [Prochlorococcus sp. AH-716-P05]
MIHYLVSHLIFYLIPTSHFLKPFLQFHVFCFFLGLRFLLSYCYKIMYSLHNGTSTISAKNLRLLNELPTLLLFIIVLLVIFKNNFPTSVATWSVVGLIIFMLASIQLYAKIRKKNENSLSNE